MLANVMLSMSSVLSVVRITYHEQAFTTESKEITEKEIP
jgi:hypothetical protein